MLESSRLVTRTWPVGLSAFHVSGVFARAEFTPWFTLKPDAHETPKFRESSFSRTFNPNHSCIIFNVS